MHAREKYNPLFVRYVLWVRHIKNISVLAVTHRKIGQSFTTALAGFYTVSIFWGSAISMSENDGCISRAPLDPTAPLGPLNEPPTDLPGLSYQPCKLHHLAESAGRLLTSKKKQGLDGYTTWSYSKKVLRWSKP